MTAGTPPAAAAGRTHRFDRSERLWGRAAQRALQAGHVVLLGATPTGSEALKNLVLPGLGRFTVVDDAPVTKRDIGANYFLRRGEPAGVPRSAALAPVIAELNPACSGDALELSPAEFIGPDGAAAADFCAANAVSAVIATSAVPQAVLQHLAAALQRARVPLLVARACGFIGYLRTQAPPHPVLYTMPDAESRVQDLRPLRPFPGLRRFNEALDPASPSLSSHDRAHLPWFTVVWHALRRWRVERAAAAGAGPGGVAPAAADDESVLPGSRAEWGQVKAVIDTYAALFGPQGTSGGTGGRLPDSYLEARERCGARLDVGLRVPPEVDAIISDRRAVAPTAADNAFWFLAHALRLFREAHGGAMPAPRRIPDFETTTGMYLELQGVFRAQADADAAEIETTARKAVAAAVDAARAAGVAVGPAAPAPGEAAAVPVAEADAASAAAVMTLADQVTEAAAREFADQAWELDFVTFPPLAEEYGAPMDPAAVVDGLEFDGRPSQAFRWYAALRASFAFEADGSSTCRPEPPKSGAGAAQLRPARGRSVGAPAAECAPGASAALDGNEAALAAEAAALWGQLLRLWPEAPADVAQREVREVVRAGAAEPAPVAAVVGAAAAQEVIKLVQGRRAPVTHTLIFDGIAGAFSTITDKQQPSAAAA